MKSFITWSGLNGEGISEEDLSVFFEIFLS